MADAPHPDAWRVTVRRRLVVVAVIFAVWSTAVQARLLWLQVHEHEHLSKKARNQIARILTLPALRGTITDREGRVLATSADADTVFAVPTAIDDPESTARKLCRVLEGCSSLQTSNSPPWWKSCRSGAHSRTSSDRYRPRKPRPCST